MRAWVAPKGPSITLSNRLYGFAPITNRFASVILRAGRLQLQFVGSGDTSHLDDPGAIPEIAPNFDLPQDAAVEAGRVETADFCIPVPTVSSRHAMFAVGSESEVMVTDLGSTNGTFINGEQVFNGMVGVIFLLST